MEGRGGSWRPGGFARRRRQQWTRRRLDFQLGQLDRVTDGEVPGRRIRRAMGGFWGINSTKEQDTGTAMVEEEGAVETEVREKLGDLLKMAEQNRGLGSRLWQAERDY